MPARRPLDLDPDREANFVRAALGRGGAAHDRPTSVNASSWVAIVLA
jgi:hypothetical protein